MIDAAPGPDDSGGSCPECHGTGFVIARDGARSAARRCACRLAHARDYRLAAARIPPRYRHCALESFAHLNKQPLMRAYTCAERLVHDYRPQMAESRRGLLFCGPCGVGKTHLAVAVLAGILESYPVSGLFAEFTDLLRRIQDTFDRRSETPSQAVLAPALESDVLVLDDLGCTRMTPWVQDTLGLILNERYNANLLTIVTTNRLLDASPGQESLGDRIGERLASRLREMCFVVEMTGDDFRRTNKSEGDDFRRRG